MGKAAHFIKKYALWLINLKYIYFLKKLKRLFTTVNPGTSVHLNDMVIPRGDTSSGRTVTIADTNSVRTSITQMGKTENSASLHPGAEL